MPHSSKSIANYFIDLATANGEALTPMKLQKIVYYAAGWFAGYTGRPLVDEEAEAWQYGPVFPSLYHDFKQFGSGAILAKAREFDFARMQFVEVPVPTEPDVLQFLNNVWSSYGKYTGIALSEMTHAANTPWDQTWRTSQGVRNAGIPFELIREHFYALAEKTRAREGAE